MQCVRNDLYIVYSKYVNSLHMLLGHPSEAMMRKTANKMNVMLDGIFDKCKVCALGLAKELNVLKTPNEHSTMINNSFYWHELSIAKSFGDKRHKLLVVDDCMDYVWHYFFN